MPLSRVREVVGRGWSRSSPTREVLAIAGVVEAPVHDRRVARDRRLGREAVAQALEPALAGRSLSRARPPGRFGFAHAIVRDAVYDELPPALRARLHSAAAGCCRSRSRRPERRPRRRRRTTRSQPPLGRDPQPAWELSLEAAREAAGLQAHGRRAHYAGRASRG